jgi:glutamate dehydrogenase (NADP+)
MRWSADEVGDRLRERMVREAEAIWRLAQDRSVTLRTAAYAQGLERISAAVDATGTAESFRGRT